MTNIPRKTYAFSIMVAHQSTKKELVYANELYITHKYVLHLYSVWFVVYRKTLFL